MVKSWKKYWDSVIDLINCEKQTNVVYIGSVPYTMHGLFSIMWWASFLDHRPWVRVWVSNPVFGGQCHLIHLTMHPQFTSYLYKSDLNGTVCTYWCFKSQTIYIVFSRFLQFHRYNLLLYYEKNCLQYSLFDILFNLLSDRHNIWSYNIPLSCITNRPIVVCNWYSIHAVYGITSDID